MTVDDELHRAADDLRRELRSINPPPLDGSATNRVAGPGGRLVLVMASLAVFGIGGFLITSGGDGPNGADGATDVIGDGTSQAAPGEDTARGEGTDGAPGPEDDVASVDPTTADRTFGTPLVVIEAPDGPDSAVLPLPGGSPAWNADGSLLLLYEVGRGHAVYDAATLDRIGLLDVDPVDIEQVSWDPTDPTRVLSVTGDELLATDVITGGSTGLHRFDGCDVVQTNGVATPISTDGRWFGGICERGDDRELVALEIPTGREIRRATSAGSVGPVPLPDGTGFVTRAADGVVQVLDDELQPTEVTFAVGTDLFVLIQTADGRQLYVTTVFVQPAEAVGSVVGFDLATGEATVAIGEAAGDPYPPPGTRLAGSLAGTGQVVATIVGDAATAADPDALDGKVLLVDFDQAEPVVTPIADHGSTRSTSTLDPSWIQPYPAVSADGSQVLFSADPGDGAVSVFVATAPFGGTP